MDKVSESCAIINFIHLIHSTVPVVQQSHSEQGTVSTCRQLTVLTLKVLFKVVHSTITKLIEWDQHIPASTVRYITSTLVAIFSVLILTTNPGYHVLKLIVLILVCHLDKLCDFLQITKLPVTLNEVNYVLLLILFVSPILWYLFVPFPSL